MLDPAGGIAGGLWLITGLMLLRAIRSVAPTRLLGPWGWTCLATALLAGTQFQHALAGPTGRSRWVFLQHAAVTASLCPMVAVVRCQAASVRPLAICRAGTVDHPDAAGVGKCGRGSCGARYDRTANRFHVDPGRLRRGQLCGHRLRIVRHHGGDRSRAPGRSSCCFSVPAPWRAEHGRHGRALGRRGRRCCYWPASTPSDSGRATLVRLSRRFRRRRGPFV